MWTHDNGDPWMTLAYLGFVVGILHMGWRPLYARLRSLTVRTFHHVIHTTFLLSAIVLSWRLFLLPLLSHPMVGWSPIVRLLTAVGSWGQSLTSIVPRPWWELGATLNLLSGCYTCCCLGRRFYKVVAVRGSHSAEETPKQPMHANVAINNHSPPEVYASALQDLRTTIEATLKPPPTIKDSSADRGMADIQRALQPILDSLAHLTLVLDTLPSTHFVTITMQQLQSRMEALQKHVDSAISLTAHDVGPMTPPMKANIVSAPACFHTIEPRTRELHPSALRIRSRTASQDSSISIPSNGSKVDLLESIVHVKTIHPVKHNKKAPHPHVAHSNRETPLSSILPGLENLDANQEAALLTQLRFKETQRRESHREPEFLTQEEQGMTMDELSRKWKLERQSRLNEQERLARLDFEPLGELTPEQKLLRRAVIRKLIADKKTELWTRRMQAQGIQVYRCETCNRLHTGNHSCTATPWTLTNPRSSTTLAPKRIIVDQTGQGIGIRTKTIPDEGRARQMIEEGHRILAEIERNRRLAQQPPLDTEMVQPPAPATSSNSVVLWSPKDPPCV